MKALILIAALAAAQPAFAQTPTPVPAESPADAAAIRLAQDRGKLIYAYDQAAWHGTDDFLAKVKDPAAIAGGYIADGPADAPRLIFFSKDVDNPQAVYVAQFRGNQLVSGKLLGPNDDRSLPPEVRAMIVARSNATRALLADPKVFGCNDKPYNTVVLPPVTAGGPMLVYLLTPQIDGKIPFGGHFRVEMGADGKAGAIRGFTRSCLSLPVPEESDAFIGISHLLDSVPTEIHVFSSFAAKRRVIVIVENREKRYYSVENGVITRLPNDQFKAENGF